MRKRLAATTAALSGLVWSAAALSDVAFVDPTGDQRAAFGGGAEVATAGPDITRVEVSNGQDGLVTFRVTIANYSELPANAFIAVFFDLDRDIGTGDLGDEAQVGWSPTTGITFERWNGERMLAAPAGALLAGFAGGVFTLEIPRAELNGARNFDFLIGTSARIDEFLATDVAPVLGTHWTYNLVLGTLSLRAASLRAVPARPVAGKPFTVSTEVTRTDTRTTVRSGSVTCAARVGGTTITARGGFVSGRARCVMRMPRSAGEKLLRGTLTVRVDQASVRRPYSFRVA